MAVFSPDWDGWMRQTEQPVRADRFPLMHVIQYESSAHGVAEDRCELGLPKDGSGLSVNVSPGGLCMLTDHPPKEGEVLRIQVPMPVPTVKTPTLAQVRWVQRLPQQEVSGGYAVGLRFLL